MKFSVVLFVQLFIAAAASAVRNMAIKPYSGHQALLAHGKAAIKYTCGAVPCAQVTDIATTALQVEEKAEEVKKKADEAVSDANEMVATGEEIKAATAAEVVATAKSVAAAAEHKNFEDQVKKEVEEVKEKKETVKKMVVAEKAVVTDPIAKETVKADEEEEKDAIKKQEGDVKAKEEEEKAVQDEATKEAAQAVTAAANTELQKAKLKTEEVALEKTKKFISPEATMPIEVEAMAAKAAVASIPPAEVEPAVQIVKAEAPARITLALNLVKEAQKEAKVAEKVQEKAKEEVKEAAAKVPSNPAKITANADTVKKLRDSVECKPCTKKDLEVKKPCEMWDFVGLKNSDLMAIQMGPSTGTKKTEVHTLGKSSNYKNWVLQTGTGLGLSAGATEWAFAAMPNGDLMCIKMGPTTGSKKTEVHILSKSSNYAKFVLHAATGLEMTTHKSWDFVAAPNGDLMCIKKGPKTGSGKTEVHILSKSSNYAKFNLHAASGLELTAGAIEWDFAAMPNGDLMCIKMGPTTGSGKTEVHILSKSSNYAKFVLHAATGLEL